MIKVRYFQVAGKCHDYNMDKCQDQINIISDSSHTTIVLCDGAGSSPYGGVAAKEASNIIVHNLHDNFERYLYDVIPDTKRRLTQVTDNGLIQIARDMDINPRLLATTVIAISTDNRGHFIGLHLGDGYIMCKLKGNEQLLKVSSPQKGYRADTTYLTMNCPLFYYMRFYRWEEFNMEQIILMSDGMDCLKNQLTAKMFLPTNASLLHQKMIEADSFDDMSYVLCESTNQ